MADEVEPGATIRVHRKAYSSAECRCAAHYEPRPSTNLQQLLQSCTCSADRILRFLPFISVLTSYQWRWLPSDIIAGLSVGVLHIPQGMGFAILASVPAVYGLYSSFFPVVIYFLFGTSRHISFGTMAVISLLVGAVVDREAIRLGLEARVMMQNLTTVDVDATKVGVACAVTLLAGVTQMVMGLLRLGVMASFMSMPFVGGFMAGAALHIATSQVPNLLGLNLGSISGTAKIPRVVIDIFRNIASINVAELLTGVVCSTLLIILKLVNERLRQRGHKIPVPGQLMVVALGIIVSHFGDLKRRYGLRVIGNIPTGLPTPEMPLMDNATAYIGDAIIIAIVSFAISITMAKIFTRRHRYEIDPSQEMLAYGIVHTVSSFFHCFAGAQAPPRSLIHEATGGRTQIGSLFAAGLVLVTFLAAAPIFEPLPLSTLSAVIFVALFPLFASCRDLKTLWRANPTDAAVWFVTWAVVTFVDIVAGLAVGVGFSLLCVVADSWLACGGRVGSIDGGIYVPLETYKRARTLPNVFIFYFPAVLYFANVERFKRQLFAATLDPNCCPFLEKGADEADPKPNGDMDQVETNYTKDNGETSTVTHSSMVLDLTGTNEPNKSVALGYEQKVDLADEGSVKSENETPTSNDRKSNGKIQDVVVPELYDLCTHKTVIVDCSAITYVDAMGLNLLEELHSDYDAVGVNFVLCRCSESLQDKLCGDTAERQTHVEVYPTLDDAVVATQYRCQCHSTSYTTVTRL